MIATKPGAESGNKSSMLDETAVGLKTDQCDNGVKGDNRRLHCAQRNGLSFAFTCRGNIRALAIAATARLLMRYYRL